MLCACMSCSIRNAIYIAPHGRNGILLGQVGGGNPLFKEHPMDFEPSGGST